MKILFAILLIPLLLVPAFAESQTSSTEKGTLDIKLTYDEIKPGVQSKIKVDFINPYTQKIQEHIDYVVSVSKDGQNVFGPIPLTHTSVGTVRIPVEFNLGEGVYSMNFGVEGILFQPIPKESASFDIRVGQAQAQQTENESMEDEISEITSENSKEEGGGCLIATATFDSELSPQVQQLRELRDNKILKTNSGTAFMTGFNQFYYSFSPTVADFEREQPIFKEIMKVTLTPMLSSLTLLNHVEIDSEQEMLGYGISLVLLNIGMYIGIPVFGILKLYQFRKN
ncbi:MAG: CFI-box-CTERM domain-containing protein [Nitrosopumilus sp.]